MTTPVDQQQYLDTPHDQSAAAVLAAYLTASAALRSRLLALVVAAYAAQGSYKDAAADAFVAMVVPAVLAAQQTMAHLTSAYLAHLVSAAGGGTTAPVATPRDAVTNLRGIDPTEVYRRPYVQVWTDLSRGKSFDDAVAAGQRRAVSLAATDVQLAKTRASQIVMSDDRRVVGYRRVLVGAHSCGLCVVASSVRYRKSNLMPIHPGCVVGGTSVFNVCGSLGNPTSGVNRVKATTRRRYTGKLVTVTTSAGKQITITPNHPVLTDKGWVPADFIHEGTNVICGIAGHRAVSGGPDKQQMPALIEDVWRSASVSGFVTVPLATEDFHGDGSNGKVDIVYADGNFPPIRDRSFVKPLSELAFIHRHGAGVPFPGLGSKASLLPGSFSTSNGDVSSFGLGGSFFGGHLCRAHKASLRASTRLDARMLQGSPYSPPLSTVLSSQSKFRTASQVLTLDGFVGELAPRPTGTRFDPSSSEFSGKGLVVYASLGRSLFDRLAGQVQLDRVVAVSRADTTSSHVYNLQTGEGWYQANGFIVSNCDCAVAPILGRSDPGRTINSAILQEGSTEQAIGSQGMKFFSNDDVIEVGDLLTEAHDAVRETFGEAAADAHRIDYRKVVLVRNHGELGPTLSVASHNFTQAQIGSGDLKAKPGTFHTLKGREVTNMGE